MKSFIWSREYKTGVDAMDAEHVILISVFNQLCAVVDAERADEAVDDIMGALVHYIRIHFRNEEKFLADNAYDHLVEHQAKHKAIAEELDSLYGDYLKDRNLDIARNLRSFVFSWLAGHILKEDKAYGAILAAR